MSENTTTTNDTTTDTTETAQVEDVQQTDTPEQQPEEPRDRVGNEAARYRRQLRETETARDELTSELDTLRGHLRAQQRQTAQHIAAAALRNPADLFAFGAQLDEVLAEDGTVDTTKVQAVVDALTADRPYLRQPGAGSYPKGEPVAGRAPRSGLAGSDSSVNSWSQLLSRR